LSFLRYAVPIVFILVFSAMVPYLGFAAVNSARVSTHIPTASFNYKILAGAHTISGIRTALVVLIEFPDLHHTRSLDQIKAVSLNQLNSYFSEVSYGKISISGQVFGWYTALHPIGYYGHDDKKPGDDDNLNQLARDAIALLPAGVDISSFNYLVIVHSGKDQAADQSEVKSDEIWSECQCSVFPNYEAVQAVYVHGKSFTEYAILSEFNGVGTFAHEWGHLFGLPDLYDTENGDSYVGYWSLMDDGNWCCPNDNQATPSYIGGWGDTLLGWLSPQVADSSVLLTAFDLKPLESAQRSAVLIPVSPTTYYFIEYREKINDDSSLPTSGVLIYFIDESLETGQGIMKLVNPDTGQVFSHQEKASALNGAVFQSNKQFSDASHQVYVAFVGGAEVVTTLFSTQQLTGSFMTTSLEASTRSLSGMFSDQLSISGTLLTQNGGPLAGQNVEVDILDSFSGQWKKIGSSTTDQLGEISLGMNLNLRVGTYRARFFYPGAKTGSVWYASAFAEFPLQITPAKMTLTISPMAIALDKALVDISVTGIHHEPLSGVTVTVYVDKAQAGTVRTDKNGKANLTIQFQIAEVGLHSVTAKADAANYEPAETSEHTFVIPLWLISAIIAAIAAAVIVVWTYKRKKRAVPSGK
jgi:M6 family metalloprotease-like protein